MAQFTDDHKFQRNDPCGWWGIGKLSCPLTLWTWIQTFLVSDPCVHSHSTIHHLSLYLSLCLSICLSIDLSLRGIKFAVFCLCLILHMAEYIVYLSIELPDRVSGNWLTDWLIKTYECTLWLCDVCMCVGMLRVWWSTCWWLTSPRDMDAWRQAPTTSRTTDGLKH